MSQRIFIVPHDLTPVADKALQQAIQLSNSIESKIILVHIVQKQSEIENAENSKSCTMANKCKRQPSKNIDDKKELEEDKTEEVPEEEDKNEEPQSNNEEPQLNNEKVPQEPPKRRGWNLFSRKSGGKYKKSTKRKNKITKKKKKNKRKTRSKK